MNRMRSVRHHGVAFLIYILFLLFYMEWVRLLTFKLHESLLTSYLRTSFVSDVKYFVWRNRKVIILAWDAFLLSAWFIFVCIIHFFKKCINRKVLFFCEDHLVLYNNRPLIFLCLSKVNKQRDWVFVCSITPVSPLFTNMSTSYSMIPYGNCVSIIK